jgi:fatty acid desaturase
MVPHPYHVVMGLEKRSAELLAASARDQRARLAEEGATASSARRWLDLLATLVALVVLVLLAMAGTMTPAESPLAGPLAAILLP